LKPFNKEEFLKAFLWAKATAYFTKSLEPAKEKTLEELRAKMEEVMEIVDKVLECQDPKAGN